MMGIGDPRAVAALVRSGGNFAQKCFLRNSFSGPGGRGRGGGIGVPRGPIGAAATESEEKDAPSGLGRGQAIDGNQQTGEVADDGVEWREAVQRRISLIDVQNRAGDSGAAGRGRGIGIVSSSPESLGARSVPFAAQSDAPPGIGRGRGIPVVSHQSAGRARMIPNPGSVAAGRSVPQSPLRSLLDAEEALTDRSDHAEEDREVRSSPTQVETTPTSSPIIFFAPQISLPSMGRGRGQVEEAAKPIGAESEMSQQFRRVDREAGRGQAKSSRAQRLQLSTEEARARAIAILEEGIEKNVAAEGERRRKAGMEKFADATEIFADRFKREPGQQGPSQTQRTRKARERPKRLGRPRGPRSSDELSVSEPSAEEQLTPEQEAELLRLDNESTFKENLHRLFLVQFEPEYAMEDFGKNPDIDEPTVLSLEEYLQSLKPMFLRDSAELSEEQKWQEAVQGSLANAPQLEKLVEAYAGRGRMTARQQIQKMEAISDKLPRTVSSEVAAFSQRALITLQNNPGLTFQQKERLMNNIVSGFSAG